MDDTIYRQAAIDALNRHLDTIRVTNNSTTEMIRRSEVMDCREIINGLPSAQPEYTEQDMREQFNAGYACGMHAAQPESKREWYMKGYRDAQANIVQCEDCKWRRNRNGTMAWIPCRALVTPDDFYCKYAERKEQ